MGALPAPNWRVSRWMETPRPRGMEERDAESPEFQSVLILVSQTLRSRGISNLNQGVRCAILGYQHPLSPRRVSGPDFHLLQRVVSIFLYCPHSSLIPAPTEASVLYAIWLFGRTPARPGQKSLVHNLHHPSHCLSSKTTFRLVVTDWHLSWNGGSYEVGNTATVDSY
ncbi:hypothetical protein PM082_016110 [Marasmius tenuissimus]|nr:hypothetical protein PM082_016110 [Marasmius tenuissimus]